MCIVHFSSPLICSQSIGIHMCVVLDLPVISCMPRVSRDSNTWWSLSGDLNKPTSARSRLRGRTVTFLLLCCVLPISLVPCSQSKVLHTRKCWPPFASCLAVYCVVWCAVWDLVAVAASPTSCSCVFVRPVADAGIVLSWKAHAGRCNSPIEVGAMVQVLLWLLCST